MFCVIGWNALFIRGMTSVTQPYCTYFPSLVYHDNLRQFPRKYSNINSTWKSTNTSSSCILSLTNPIFIFPGKLALNTSLSTSNQVSPFFLVSLAPISPGKFLDGASSTLLSLSTRRKLTFLCHSMTERGSFFHPSLESKDIEKRGKLKNFTRIV